MSETAQYAPPVAEMDPGLNRTHELTATPFSSEVELVYDATTELGNTLPFNPGSLGKIILAGLEVAPVETQVDVQNITRINEKHGRSFERETIVFADEFGNRFRHLSLKGAGPYKVEKHGAPSADEVGFTPTGFASNAARDRIISASRAFRELGIDTEYPIVIGKPDSFPVLQDDGDVENMTPQEIYAEIDTELVVPDEHELNVYIRATKTPVRIDDLKLDRSKSGNAYEIYSPEEVERVKGTLAQIAEDLKATEPNDESILFDPADPGSVRDFVMDTLSARLGKSIAKIHKAGLVHNSLSPGNTTALGGIVDLDSVAGPAFGLEDEKQLPIDALGDLYELLNLHNFDSETINRFQPHVRDRPTNLSSCDQVITSLVDSGVMASLPGKLNSLSSDSVQLFTDKVLSAYERESTGNQFAESVVSLLKRAEVLRLEEVKNLPSYE